MSATEDQTTPEVRKLEVRDPAIVAIGASQDQKHRNADQAMMLLRGGGPGSTTTHPGNPGDQEGPCKCVIL